MARCTNPPHNYLWSIGNIWATSETGICTKCGDEVTRSHRCSRNGCCVTEDPPPPGRPIRSS